MRTLKSLGCLLALLLAAIILLPSKAMAADVAINDTNFPDDNFRSIVAEEFDEDLNGTLSTEEIDAIVDLNVDVEGIYDLTGIEHFIKLRILSCVGNELTALDVTHNPELTKLYCGVNSIKKLDVSQNPELTLLRCYANKLTALNVSKNTKLEELDCSENAIKKLNVSNNTKLGFLSCEMNKLTKLDVSKNTRLYYLDCSVNDGIALTGLPQLTKLVVLSCNDCGLTSLDIAANTKLENLYCEGNQITGLDIHLAPALLTAYTSKETLKTVKTNSIFYRYVVEEDDEI